MQPVYRHTLPLPATLFRKLSSRFGFLLFACIIVWTLVPAFGHAFHPDQVHAHPLKALHIADQQAGIELKTPVPPPQYLVAFETEPAGEDTDESQPDPDNAALSPVHLPANREYALSCSLKQCLDQLDAGFRQRPVIPLFLLHHAWKSDLS